MCSHVPGMVYEAARKSGKGTRDPRLCGWQWVSIVTNHAVSFKGTTPPLTYAMKEPVRRTMGIGRRMRTWESHRSLTALIPAMSSTNFVEK